jgi:hypothetical protein
MRKILFISFLFTHVGNHLVCQTPEIMGYQAIIRKNDNSLVSNQKIGIEISILEKSISGNIVFIELQSPTTSANGLVTLNIGDGISVLGSLNKINWVNGPFFVRTRIDIQGGNNYTLESNSQLLSVPYSYYSEQAKKLTKHFIGEYYQGGIIFDVYNDQDGNEHGLIVSLNDVSNGTGWSNVGNTLIGIGAQSLWNGQENSNAVINQAGHTTSAAQICTDYSYDGFSDWYLPSIDELNLLRNARYFINKIADNDGDPLTNPITHFDYYWSSTEAKSNTAFVIQFGTGDIATIGKNTAQYRIRAVRKF